MFCNNDETIITRNGTKALKLLWPPALASGMCSLLTRVSLYLVPGRLTSHCISSASSSLGGSPS